MLYNVHFESKTKQGIHFHAEYFHLNWSLCLYQYAKQKQLQEPSSLQLDHLHISNGVLLTGDDSAENVPGDVRAAEDGGKEEMFVDCPDELILSDNREAMAIPETQESLEEKDDMQNTRVLESANGTHEFKVVYLSVLVFCSTE